MTFCKTSPGPVGYGKPAKISGATLPTTFIRNFGWLFVPSPMKKSAKFMQTGFLNGGLSAFWFGFTTAMASKDFTGTFVSPAKPCPKI